MPRPLPFFAALPLFLTVATQAEVSRETLWKSGAGDYHTYRIPAVAATTKGTVLAFCEGRKTGGGDSGNIDLVLRRSEDGGKTWGAQQVVWDDADNTCGNPCPVVDETTGTVFLFSTWNLGSDHEGQIIAGKSQDTRRVFVTSSADEGRTWTKPAEVTAAVKKPDWTWYATGPGSGLQIKNGPNAGRLVLACDHIEKDSKRYFSHAVYSDDHGKTWQLGGTTPKDKVNECEAVELAGGRLMLNMRNYDRTMKTRQTAVSADGGRTWSDQALDPILVEPICQASILRFSWPGEGSENVVLFSNPASGKRERLTVRASLDDARTWPRQLILHEGPAAYSDLVRLPSGTAACLYEAGEKNAYETIVWARFGLADLGKPE